MVCFFIFWSIVSKEIKLIIPGGIIEGVGLGILFVNLFKNVNEISKGGIFFIGFSFGWLLIVIFSKAIFKKNVLWPFIPFSILFIFGTILFLGEKGVSLLEKTTAVWPYLLIFAGLVIILKYFSRKNRR